MGIIGFAGLYCTYNTYTTYITYSAYSACPNLPSRAKISGTKPESPVPPNIACPQGISGRCAVCGRDAHRGRRDVRCVPRAVCAPTLPNPPV